MKSPARNETRRQCRTPDPLFALIPDSAHARDLANFNRALISGIPGGILTYTPAGDCILANETAARMLGGSIEEVQQQNFRELDSWRAAGLTAKAEQALGGRVEEVVGANFVSSFGREVSVDVRFSRFLVGGDWHLLVLLLDAAERQRLEAQLFQAQKMEVVGQLAGGVAHDFNNILAAAMLQLNCLQARPGLSGEMQNSLSELEAAIKRGSQLTRQLLLFSRRQAMELRPIDLRELVAGVFRMLRRPIGEHIDVVCPASGPPLWIQADPGMIEQVIMNLCVNARDAMPEGGRLTIALAREEWDEAAAQRQAGARAGRFVVLSIRDTGCGMDEATQRRIFEPFFTTKEVGKGTGLGLSTVDGIVKQHRGWVHVQSAVQKGTTFEVYLPEHDASPRKEGPAMAGEVPTGTETILVIEDEAPLREMVAATLRDLGYRVLDAADVPEALMQWQKHGDDVDLVLTDILLPGGVSGLDLAEAFLRARTDLPVIVSSGYASDASWSARLDRTGTRFLPKPYRVDELAFAVRRTLDGRREGPDS